MATSEEFLQAVQHRAGPADSAADLLPTAMVLATVDVLPIDGAGLSVFGDVRLPIGSSDRHAAFIERLQFTFGAGPCLDAAERGSVLVSTERDIERIWPSFHAEMIAQTPYRATMSCPLGIAGYTSALNLYVTESSGESFPPIEDVTEGVARPMSELMSDPPTVADRLGVELPVWLTSRSVEDRLDVWRAVGMVMQHHGYQGADSLAALRSYAYADQRTLDEVSRDLVHGKLRTAEVLDG